MALPKLLRRLFDNAGFGNRLNKEITADHSDYHKLGGRDELQLDGSQITTGTISRAVLPKEVQERRVEVSSKGAMMLLTIDDVQNGDFIKVLDPGVWYIVVDDTKLGTNDGFDLFGTTHISDTGEIPKSEAAVKLAKQIQIKMTGVNGISPLWDGSTDLTIPITSIDKQILGDISLNKVVHIGESTMIDKDYLCKLICCDNPILLHLNETDMSNGWNCYIKNISTDKCTIACTLPTTIDGTQDITLSPLITAKVFFDGTNFITLNTTPIITL